MNRTDLQKLIDVCRGEADLQLPDVRRLAEIMSSDPEAQRRWEKTQQQDAELRQMLRDVTVPEGLDTRLLAALGFAVQSLADSPLAAEPGDGADDRVSPLPTSSVTDRRHIRRWQTWAVAITGIAAILLVSLFFWPTSGPELANEDQAHVQALEWISKLDDRAWQGSAPLQRFSLPAQLRRAPRGWQAVPANARSPHVICYDLRSPGLIAYLFVAITKHPSNLPTTPPTSTYPKGRWYFAGWQAPANHGVVYVMAIERDPRQYRNLIGRPANLAGTQTVQPHTRFQAAKRGVPPPKLSLAGKV